MDCQTSLFVGLNKTEAGFLNKVTTPKWDTFFSVAS
jgi:hypothetical protein